MRSHQKKATNARRSKGKNGCWIDSREIRDHFSPSISSVSMSSLRTVLSETDALVTHNRTWWSRWSLRFFRRGTGNRHSLFVCIPRDQIRNTSLFAFREHSFGVKRRQSSCKGFASFINQRKRLPVEKISKLPPCRIEFAEKENLHWSEVDDFGLNVEVRTVRRDRSAISFSIGSRSATVGGLFRRWSLCQLHFTWVETEYVRRWTREWFLFVCNLKVIRS